MLIHAHSHIFHAKHTMVTVYNTQVHLVLELIMFNLTMPGCNQTGAVQGIQLAQHFMGW